MTLGSSPHPFKSQVAVLSTKSVPKGNFWLCFDVHSGRKHARSNEHSLGVSNLYTGFVSTVLLDSKVQYKVLIHAEKSLDGVAFHGGQVFQQAGTRVPSSTRTHKLFGPADPTSRPQYGSSHSRLRLRTHRRAHQLGDSPSSQRITHIRVKMTSNNSR